MTLRGHINGALRKTTGYQIVRAGSVPPAPLPPEPARRGAARKSAKQPNTEPAPKRASKNDPNHPQDYDADTRATVELIRGRTMNHHTKTQSLIEAVRYVHRHEVPGAIVECGVWRGGSMLAVANTLVQLGATDRDLYLFDTYTGMTEPTERDIRINEGKHATELLNADDEPDAPMQWSRPANYVATLDDVREGFGSVEYPEERVHFVVGAVEKTVPGAAPQVISVLRLDTDWYASTKHELDHLYQRLSPGGVLILDDYGTWQGAREATDEFLAETGEPLLLNRIHRSRIAVKPGLRSVV
jgi:hypothetical protein